MWMIFYFLKNLYGLNICNLSGPKILKLFVNHPDMCFGWEKLTSFLEILDCWSHLEILRCVVVFLFVFEPNYFIQVIAKFESKFITN